MSQQILRPYQRYTFSFRAMQASHPMTRRLFALMERKKTNLALSLDVTEKARFLDLLDLLGPEICVLKTHIDTLQGFDEAFLVALKALREKHDFLIFEDRKFADIGETVKHQFRKGVYHIAEWADIINAHGIAGPGTIEGLKQARQGETGLLLLLQMSSRGNLLTPEMAAKIRAFAEEDPDFVMGFIAQEYVDSIHPFVYMTPGVHLDKTGDALGQQYRSPLEVMESGMDIIIVGRAIYGDAHPLEQARRYREAGWTAYQNQLDYL